MMKLTHVPVVNAAMVIRRPVAEVFNAFVDPAITSRFWFTKGSGLLESGARVTWEWEMYHVSVVVTVTGFEPERSIRIDWGEPSTTVVWTFEPQADGGTYVQIANSGFHGDGDEVVAQAIDSMGGFTNLLAAAKAYLEHGIELNLVADHAPAAGGGA